MERAVNEILFNNKIIRLDLVPPRLNCRSLRKLRATLCPIAVLSLSRLNYVCHAPSILSTTTFQGENVCTPLRLCARSLFYRLNRSIFLDNEIALIPKILIVHRCFTPQTQVFSNRKFALWMAVNFYGCIFLF